MKKIHALGLVCLMGVSSSTFAHQYCSDKITVTDGVYTAPTGWYVTENTLEQHKNAMGNEVLSFDGAGFNFDRLVGERNGNRISCAYVGNNGNSRIEITSEQEIATPDSSSATHWEPVFEGGLACAWPHINTNDCPWDYK